MTKILVIEDQLAVRQNLEDILLLENYDVGCRHCVRW